MLDCVAHLQSLIRLQGRATFPHSGAQQVARPRSHRISRIILPRSLFPLIHLPIEVEPASKIEAWVIHHPLTHLRILIEVLT